MDNNMVILNGTELVSIIVPAYNVEKYIGRCVSSIQKQTYQKIEIIAVDDGSTDNTGNLLDDIQKGDGRVCVIHQNNAGVSTARNAGIDASSGEYLIFVDGDDYLAEDFVEYMLSIARKTGAEFCMSVCSYTKENEKQSQRECIKVLSSEDATALLLSLKVTVGCWNKLFHRNFLVRNKLRFSSDLFYGEGLYFITTAAQLAACVGVGNRKVYYYRRNNISSATSRFNVQNLYNGENSIRRIAKELRFNSKKIDTMLTLHYSVFCLGAAVKLKANHLAKEYRQDYLRWMKYVKQHIWMLLFSDEVSLYRKLMLTCGCISPGVIAKMDVIRRKRISENSFDD